MSKKESAPEPQTTYGVNVSVPNISKAKFEAIKALAQSNLELAKALNSVGINTTISHNVINSATTGININSFPTDTRIDDWDDSPL